MIKRYEIGALILRLFLGFTFFIHGLDKFQGGISNTVGFFDSLGLPGFLAYVVVVIELIGGIALILGIGTRVVSILIALLMVGAIIKVKLAKGFLGGYELDVALLAISIYLAIANRSLFALDNIIFKSNQD
ncbi:DoxX family protein [Pseudalkalibacillus decolorationis]|uniref:DoxX family protein n=1 Tax=Pseudalkalibacillus decolorationis TaxID=163879 RepID=UPI0021486FA7|nr:DoxX family protein [Pseudalkalibacillus decolorationis]